MNCEVFQTVVSDLARDQIMEANDRAGALAHVAECHGCASKWEDERHLSGGLRDLAKSMESLSAPQQLEAKVLAAFRERSTVVPLVRPAYLQRRYWFAAIAAALLIVFGIVMVRGRVFTRSQPQTAGPVIQKPNDSPNVPPSIIQETAVAPKKVETPNRVHPRRRNTSNSLALTRPSSAGRASDTTNAVTGAKNNNETGAVASEVTTDFYPISYGTSLNLQDGGQLFRVELPRSAVARFGLPVNIDRSSERVKADVLVGADGLAQAIRFVH
jgi:hypothetical protein